MNTLTATRNVTGYVSMTVTKLRLNIIDSTLSISHRLDEDQTLDAITLDALDQEAERIAQKFNADDGSQKAIIRGEAIVFYFSMTRKSDQEIANDIMKIASKPRKMFNDSVLVDAADCIDKFNKNHTYETRYVSGADVVIEFSCLSSEES